MLMDGVQRIQHLRQDGEHLMFRKGSSCAFLNITQRLTLDVVHNIIDRAVFFKKVEHLHDMIVVETNQAVRLFREFLFLGVERPLIVGDGNMHLGCLIFSYGDALQEKLFDGTFLSQGDIHALIGVAETA